MIVGIGLIFGMFVFIVMVIFFVIGEFVGNGVVMD